MRKSRATAGATLVETIVAMVVIGLVAAGILSAFVFSRRLTHRSGGELSTMGFVEEISEQLRAAPVNGLTLNPGVYVDTNMLSTARPPGAGTLAALDLPAAFQLRYQTNQGRTPAATWADHADGRVLVVEGATDLDGDGLVGIDLSNPADGVIDLRRVRVKVRFTTPST